MTPDEDAMGGFGDDPRLAESLRALQNLGEGPAPAPSEKLAAFLADPTGGAAAPAAGWGWVMKEKAARLSRAGKVLVIGGGIALAGAVSATAAWQVTSVLPSHDGETPRHPAPISSPATDEHTSGGAHSTPTPTAAPGDDSTKGKGNGTHGKDAAGSSGSGNDQGEDAGKGKGSGKDGSDEGSGSGKHGDDGKAGSGNGSGDDASDSGSGSGDSSGDGGSGSGSGDSQGDGSGGSGGSHGSGSGDQGSGASDSGATDASPAPVD